MGTERNQVDRSSVYSTNWKLHKRMVGRICPDPEQVHASVSPRSQSSIFELNWLEISGIGKWPGPDVLSASLHNSRADMDVAKPRQLSCARMVNLGRGL